MALPYYMTMEGEQQGNIEGWCAATGHSAEMQCHALDQRIHIPFDDKTGQPTGLRMHGPLKVTKSYDKASPLIYKALVTGERMKEVNLKFYRISKIGEEEHYFTIKLTSATLVEVRPMMHNHFDPDLAKYDHQEEISFTYGQIEWRWEPDGISAMDEAVTPGV
jgi:type VI secretion system secreted protein Hcp